MIPKEISFDHNSCSLLLKLDEQFLNIPKFVSQKAESSGLIKKPEFHLTIFGYGAGKRIATELSRLTEGEKEETIKKIKKLAEVHLGEIHLKEEFYSLKKSYQQKIGGEETRETIIQMGTVGGLKDFFGAASKLVNINLEVPPSHVTLFSKSTNKENMTAGIGVGSDEDLRKSSPEAIFPPIEQSSYHTIALPTRSQPDTIIAIFILKYFGKEVFLGINEAKFEVVPRIENETDESLEAKGILAIDIGGGRFDHHNKSIQTTASSLVASFLNENKNPALTKLLQFVERDDFYGKGTISTDPLDRAFGLSGLIGSLNKKYVSEPGRVIEIILPIIEAFYT